MKIVFDSSPDSLKAAIGPSIGPNSFVVHEDVKNAFQQANLPVSELCQQLDDNTFLINLWRANSWLLEQAGLNPNNIHASDICTYTHHDEFYSARYEKNNKCGRNINVIRLKGKCEV